VKEGPGRPFRPSTTIGTRPSKLNRPKQYSFLFFLLLTSGTHLSGSCPTSRQSRMWTVQWRRRDFLSLFIPCPFRPRAAPIKSFSTPSPFPLSFLSQICRQAGEFYRRSPQSPTMNIVDSDVVRRPRLLPLASPSSLSSGASPDALRLSYFTENRRTRPSPELTAAQNAPAATPRRSRTRTSMSTTPASSLRRPASRRPLHIPRGPLRRHCRRHPARSTTAAIDSIDQTLAAGEQFPPFTLSR
jgi:hypothetical protein